MSETELQSLFEKTKKEIVETLKLSLSHIDLIDQISLSDFKSLDIKIIDNYFKRIKKQVLLIHDRLGHNFTSLQCIAASIGKEDSYISPGYRRIISDKLDQDRTDTSQVVKNFKEKSGKVMQLSNDNAVIAAVGELLDQVERPNKVAESSSATKQCPLKVHWDPSFNL